MARVKIIGNDIVNIKSHADNNIQLIINLGEISSEELASLYDIKKDGEFQLLIANLDDWGPALLEAAHIALDGLPDSVPEK